MAANDSKGAGDSGKQRSQVRSSLPAGKPPATAAESTLGVTVGRGGVGPTELPPQFGRYRVIKKLGGGGMGTVYLVENIELEREEALKVPHFSDDDDAHVRERFLRETKSAARLDHANLCPVYDAGVLDGVYYLTMRFLKGKLLSDYTGKPQPARKAVEIVAKLAQALEAAHDKGVIHRDLKPGNVMMVAGVGPVVMDFGLAKQVLQADQKLTQAGSMLGTPSYMPPEQVNGELERMGPASDVYSLGVILYELLTGRLPFEGTMAMIFGQILYTEPPLPSDLVPGLNPTLDGICRKAMAKESAERYPSMDAFAAALLDFLRSTPATAGAGNLVPTGVDETADVQSPTAAPGCQPAGNSAVFPAATVPPRARLSLPPTPREAKASAVMRYPDGARTTIPTAGATARKRKIKRPFRVNRTVGIGLAVGGAVLGILCCIVIVILSKGSSETPTFKNSLGMEFVFVPKGKSWLGGGGGGPGDKEVVIADDFYLGKYEVTQGEWRKVTGLTPSWFSRTGGGKDLVRNIADAELDRFPVENVSWDDVQKFLERLNTGEQEAGWIYRLPLATEWEYACRGGPLSDERDSAYDFYFDKPTNQLLPRQANFNKNLQRTCKVGLYPPNRLGLYDMHGNVWEWCNDPERAVDGASSREPRGGCWSTDPAACTAAFSRGPARWEGRVGLRVARSSGK